MRRCAYNVCIVARDTIQKHKKCKDASLWFVKTNHKKNIIQKKIKIFGTITVTHQNMEVLMMNNYEELKMSVVIFEQEDIITMSKGDNQEDLPGGWEQ